MHRGGHHPTRHFYPRPPWGGRPDQLSNDTQEQLFLSTPSVGRATVVRYATKYQFSISIHALRGEGDNIQCGLDIIQFNFYPRPPWGGRPTFPQEQRITAQISIHALRGEGDRLQCNYWYDAWISIHALRGEGDQHKRRFSKIH